MKKQKKQNKTKQNKNKNTQRSEIAKTFIFQILQILQLKTLNHRNAEINTKFVAETSTCFFFFFFFFRQKAYIKITILTKIIKNMRPWEFIQLKTCFLKLLHLVSVGTSFHALAPPEQESMSACFSMVWKRERERERERDITFGGTRNSETSLIYEFWR